MLDILYFPSNVHDECNQPTGYFVKSKVDNIPGYMHALISNGGDIDFFYMEGGRLALKLIDEHGETKLCLSMWDFKWKKQIAALKTIQRAIKNWVFRHRLKGSQLKVLKEFKLSFIKHNIFPREITLKIIGDLPYKPVASQKLHDQYPIQRVETKSFKGEE